MVAKLVLLMKAVVLFSPQMGLILFHGGDELPQFETLTPEELLLSSRTPVATFSTAVSPQMANLWLAVLITLPISGISLAQTITSS